MPETGVREGPLTVYKLASLRSRGYDNLNRVTSETIASDPNAINGAVNYTCDAVGNRKQMTSSLTRVPAGLFNYDANDRFTAGDTYDNDGNTISSGGVANVYDFENHLIQRGGVSIKYDGDGNRDRDAPVTRKRL